MAATTLSELANWAEIIGASSILTGLVFGWFQIRQYRTQQRDAIAINIAQTFYSGDLARSISLLHEVPDGISLEDLRLRGDRYMHAAITVATSFETMGLLIFKRIAPFDLVLDLAGGIVSSMSRKLVNVHQELRSEQNQPSWGEWFEWLGDQAEHVKHERTPAHIQHRDWRP